MSEKRKRDHLLKHCLYLQTLSNSQMFPDLTVKQKKSHKATKVSSTWNQQKKLNVFFLINWDFFDKKTSDTSNIQPKYKQKKLLFRRKIKRQRAQKNKTADFFLNKNIIFNHMFDHFYYLSRLFSAIVACFRQYFLLFVCRAVFYQ